MVKILVKKGRDREQYPNGERKYIVLEINLNHRHVNYIRLVLQLYNMLDPLYKALLRTKRSLLSMDREVLECLQSSNRGYTKIKDRLFTCYSRSTHFLSSLA